MTLAITIHYRITAISTTSVSRRLFSQSALSSAKSRKRVTSSISSKSSPSSSNSPSKSPPSSSKSLPSSITSSISSEPLPSSISSKLKKLIPEIPRIEYYTPEKIDVNSSGFRLIFRSTKTPRTRAHLLHLLILVELILCTSVAQLIWVALRNERLEKDPNAKDSTLDAIPPVLVLFGSVSVAGLLIYMPTRTPTAIHFHIPSQKVYISHPGWKNLYPSPYPVDPKFLRLNKPITSRNEIPPGPTVLSKVQSTNMLLYESYTKIPLTLDAEGEFNVRKLNQLFSK